MPRRTAPRHVALRAVGRGDPPHVVRVSRKLPCKAQAERLVGQRRGYGVLPPVDVRSRASRRPRKSTHAWENWWTKSGSRWLMYLELTEAHDRTLPRAPRGGRQRVGWRADAEQVQDHQLAVVGPPGLEKAGLRLPPHRQQVRVAVQHPREIHALVDCRRIPDDGGVIAETPAGREDAGKQAARCRWTTARTSTHAPRSPC